MKITNYTSYHSAIGSEYENIENIWVVLLEDTDPYNLKIKERFKEVEITQKKYLNNPNGMDDEMTWYRGYSTNTFDSKTKDKQKLFIIDEVVKFMDTFRNHALVAQWSEQSAHNWLVGGSNPSGGTMRR